MLLNCSFILLKNNKIMCEYPKINTSKLNTLQSKKNLLNINNKTNICQQNYC